MKRKSEKKNETQVVLQATPPVLPQPPAQRVLRKKPAQPPSGLLQIPEDDGLVVPLEDLIPKDVAQQELKQLDFKNNGE